MASAHACWRHGPVAVSRVQEQYVDGDHDFDYSNTIQTTHADGGKAQ